MHPAPKGRDQFLLLTPPYTSATTHLSLPLLEPPRGREGVVLVWQMGTHFTEAMTSVRFRPKGVTLVAVLPPGETRSSADLYHMVEICRPTSILPYHDEPSTEDIRLLVNAGPKRLVDSVVDYLVWRGTLRGSGPRRLVRRTLELSGELRSVSGLARSLYLSRRALGRRFAQYGLPVPSRCLHFGRILRASLRILGSDDPLSQIAFELGYPDSFALSNQMKRLVGVRPTELKARIGWEWIVESWLWREYRRGHQHRSSNQPRSRQTRSKGGST